jgi:hypothetical protein
MRAVKAGQWACLFGFKICIEDVEYSSGGMPAVYVHGYTSRGIEVSIFVAEIDWIKMKTSRCFPKRAVLLLSNGQ